jgi:hypothetical protein
MNKNIYSVLGDIDDTIELSPNKSHSHKKHLDPIGEENENKDIDNESIAMYEQEAMADLDLEIINIDEHGNVCTERYSIPYKPIYENEKRLLCYSTIHQAPCPYQKKCTYAHSLLEQKIDDERYFLYQIILDANLMNFFSFTDPKTEELYKTLLFSTHVCDKCTVSKCTGGYNCRNGIFDLTLKICRNDLMTGECLNKINKINVISSILNKIENITVPPSYDGCINGHHLSTRGLLPYFKYVHLKEQSTKNQYQSVRYIDLQSAYRYFKDDSTFSDPQNHNDPSGADSSESSTDDEINEMFKKYKDSDLFNDEG